MPKVNPEEVKVAIRKVYADAKKAGKFVPPPVARAIALQKVTGKKTSSSTLKLKKNSKGMYA